MLKLIKLEWKKNHIGKYIIKVIVLAALITLFIYSLAYLGIANDPDTGVPDAAPGNEMISASIEYGVPDIGRCDAVLVYYQCIQEWNDGRDVFVSDQTAENIGITDACGMDL